MIFQVPISFNSTLLVYAQSHHGERSSLHCCSVVSTLCDLTDCSMPGSLSFTIFQNMLKLTSIESMMPFNHLVLCHPLILPSIFPSIMVSPNDSALCIRWPNYWNFSISPSNEYSVLISFSWLVWSPCNTRDCQESSPTPQFKSINSSALRLFFFHLFLLVGG